MEHMNVRINRLSLVNLKCVMSGSINFSATETLRQEKSCVFGIYGQNGSGKTVVIEALSLVRSILSGRQISARYLDVIMFGKNNAILEIEFSIIGSRHTDCTAIYKCELEKRENPNETRSGVDFNNAKKSIITITSESLMVAGFIHGVKYAQQYIARTDETMSLIKPKNKCRLLFGNDELTLKKLENQKIIALYGSRSFLFSDQAIEVIWKECTCDFKLIINDIRFFAIARLFIVGGETQNDIPFPFNFVIESEEKGFCGQIPFSLESKAILPKDILTIFEAIIPPLNLVLASMIPGLSVKYKSKEANLDENDNNFEIELFASRQQGDDFPLRNESLGIRKIISFLSLLIATYNDSSYALVVDEFDSSIFEFLLGEIVGILKDSGKGQFIFTSHNLRPLEKLDAPSICFTTTDSKNRYVKLKKKTTNNLRDIYFRVLSLGSNEFELYNGESKNAIAFALRQAGLRE